MMDVTMEPLLIRDLRNRIKSAQETNASLASEVQDDEALQTLNECETRINTLFADGGGASPPLEILVREFHPIVQQIGQCHEHLNKKIKKGAHAQAHEIREKAKQSLEDAKGLLELCQNQQIGFPACDTKPPSDEAEQRQIVHDLYEEVKAPCSISTDRQIRDHLYGWTCRFNRLTSDQHFIAPELAKSFFEKLQGDIRRMSINAQDSQEQQESLANLLKIRELMSQLQTVLLNRVYVDRPLASRR
jgi:hypothetical protein